MTEFFKGLAIKAGLMRTDEQEKLDNMIENYRNGGTRGHRETADMIELAIFSSPDLKARTLEAVGKGYLSAYSDVPVVGVASASYQAHDHSMRIPPKVGKNDYALKDKIFTLGHETEHARSTQGVDYAKRTLLPAINALARAPSDGPRDYTRIIGDFVEQTRGEEARAHIGGFNAIASSVIADREKDRQARPQDLLRDLYEAFPGRMGDFIAKTSDGIPAKYALKEGLSLGKDGLMPYSPGNIDAMKVHYADKAQLGAEHMNYRQECIEFASGLVGEVERGLARIDMEDRQYRIDPVRLQAHAELGLPEDGIIRVRGIENLEDFLGKLEPIVIVAPQPAAPLAESSLAIQPPMGPQQPLPPVTELSQPAPPLPVVRLEAQPGDPPLFAQALPLVVELNRTNGLGEPQELRNIAAALAASAHDRGMTAIERVVMSEDSRGIIVSQGAGELRQNASVQALAASATPESESLGRLPAPVQSSQLQQPQQESLAIGESSEAPRRSAH